MWFYNENEFSSRHHRLLIYDVKRTTKIDGMSPFKLITFDFKFVPVFCTAIQTFVKTNPKVTRNVSTFANISLSFNFCSSNKNKESFTTLLPNKGIILFHLNVQSQLPKIEELRYHIANSNIKILPFRMFSGGVTRLSYRKYMKYYLK